MNRVQKTAIAKDLQKKMVFLAGPRQAGKTWLAKEIAAETAHSVYLNYDSFQDRGIMEAQSWLDSTELLILDELHKMPNWKGYLKGLYDTKPGHMQLLVTGSARLDISYQFGDSLAGRYFLHRLMPFSPAELKQLDQPVALNRLLEWGNFPEPYLATELVNAKRWRQQYTNALLTEDVLDFNAIHNLKAIKLVFELLRERVASPISYQSIAEDVGISPTTVKKYIEILESLYIVFKITPYSKNIARSLLKEPKIYFYDSGLVKGDAGAQFENLVAICLLKSAMAKKDYLAENIKLHYLKTKQGHEVDFALVQDNKIMEIIEVKHKNPDIPDSLKYFHQKYNLSAKLIVKQLRNGFSNNEIQVVPGSQYLSNLYL